MKYWYCPAGVCSQSIEFEMDNDVVCNIRFEGGCNGNLQGISKLANGRTAKDIIELLSGICCGEKLTSCPDQLAMAIREAQTDDSSV